MFHCLVSGVLFAVLFGFFLCVGKKGNGCTCNLPVIQDLKQARTSGRK